MGKRLEGKVAIVTGAASGIGKASVELFREEGATVVGADIGEGADERADAGDETTVRGLVEQVVRQHRRLDIFFANAGVSGGMATLSKQTPEDWAEILKINLVGCALAIKHAAPAMTNGGSIICTASVAGLRSGAGGAAYSASKAGVINLIGCALAIKHAAPAMTNGGSIICTASVAGLRSGAGGAAYSASKAGVINLVQNACQQLGGSGIRVNAICPGLVETGMTSSMYEAARERGQAHRIGELNPLRRGGEPIEVARAALFLASDESSYVNGHALVVDGGLTSSMPVARNFDFNMLAKP